MTNPTKHIDSTFAVIKPNLQVDTVEVTPTLYQDLDEKFDLFQGHTLVAAHHFDRNWSTWEVHPAGDEIVVLLSGQCQLIIKHNDHNQSIELNHSGEYPVVPKGLWHKALTEVATHMLFITPGEKTANAPEPD